jgi:hypothetical protein
VVISSSINRVACLVAVVLAAAIVWIGLRDGDALLIVLGVGLLLVGPFVRRTDSTDHAAAFRAQVDRLQAMPAPPANPADAQPTAVPGMSPQVLAELMAGNKIGAIKRYREEYGSGLKEAKDAVDEFERRMLLPR